MWWNELSYDDWYPQKLERRIRRAIAKAVREAVAGERAYLFDGLTDLGLGQYVRRLDERYPPPKKKGKAAK